METFSSPETPSVPEKKIRLVEIFQEIANATPASTAEEANKIVAAAFQKIESFYNIPDRAKMVSYPFGICSRMKHKEHEIRYDVYNRHTVFYRENGSIDIRQINASDFPNERILAEKPEHFKENLQLIFEKPGADGKRVWE